MIMKSKQFKLLNDPDIHIMSDYRTFGIKRNKLFKNTTEYDKFFEKHNKSLSAKISNKLFELNIRISHLRKICPSCDGSGQGDWMQEMHYKTDDE